MTMKPTPETLRERIARDRAAHIQRLAGGLKASLVDLERFQSWFADSMSDLGMDVQRFAVPSDTLSAQPSCLKSLRENPGALQSGSNVVGQLRGASPNRPKILLFGHADKAPQSFEFASAHPELTEREGRLYGPGIADDVSGLAVMVSALSVMNDLDIAPAGDLMFASILGKQMGVYGTYGLMTRFGPMEEAIYVHPAESGSGLREIKMSSNGLVEVHIETTGQAPTSGDNQTVFSATGVNAAFKAIRLCDAVTDWAQSAARTYPDAHLEKAAGRSVSAMLTRFTAGETGEIGDMPLHAHAVVMVSFPPCARLASIEEEIAAVLDKTISEDAWLREGHARYEWGDRIAESISADGDSPFLKKASRVISAVTGEAPVYYYGHGGSDIRYPMLHWGAQAFGFGPKAGDLGLEGEWVDEAEYLDTIVALVLLLTEGSSEGTGG